MTGEQKLIEIPAFFANAQMSTGPLLVSAKSDGNEIREAQAEFGFAHRGMLDLISARTWDRSRFYWSHLAPDSAPLVEKVLSEWVESALRIHVPQRANQIRSLICELSDASRLLKCLSGCFRHLGMSPARQQVHRMRESVLDLFELMTGSRHAFYFIQPGGVRWDVSDGFLARTGQWCERFEKDLDLLREFVRLVQKSSPALDSIGRVSFWREGRHGIELGVVSRMQIMIQQMAIAAGSIHSRVQDIAKMTGLNQVVGVDTMDWVAPENENIQINHDSLRGPWTLIAAPNSNKGIRVRRLVCPSYFGQQWIQEALLGAQEKDLPLILESLDVSSLEVDQ